MLSGILAEQMMRGGPGDAGGQGGREPKGGWGAGEGLMLSWGLVQQVDCNRRAIYGVRWRNWKPPRQSLWSPITLAATDAYL